MRFNKYELICYRTQCGECGQWTDNLFLLPLRYPQKQTLHATSLLINNRSNYAASTAIIAKLAEVDALPSAQIEAAIGDGDGE